MTDTVSGRGLRRISEELAQFERLPPTSKQFAQTLTNLFSALCLGDGLSPDLARKTNYIGSKFREITSKHRQLDDKLFNLFANGVLVNSKLLEEGLLYNLLYYFMNERLNFLTNPLFTEAHRIYGALEFGMSFTKIDLPSIGPKPVLENNHIHELATKINELRKDLTEDDSRTLFAMSNGMHLSKDRVLSVVDRTSLPIIAANLTSENKDIQAFAAELALVHLHKGLLLDQPTLFQISFYLVDKIKNVTQKPTEELSPILTLLLQTLHTCKSTGENLNFKIYSFDFVRKFTLLTNDDWVDEQAHLYQIVQKIIEKCRKTLNFNRKGTLTKALLIKQKELTEHSLVWIVSKTVNDLFAGKKNAVFPVQANPSPTRFPISSEVPLLSTAEDFRRFCVDHSLYFDLDQRIRARNAIGDPTIKSYYFPNGELKSSRKPDRRFLNHVFLGTGEDEGAGAGAGSATVRGAGAGSAAVEEEGGSGGAGVPTGESGAAEATPSTSSLEASVTFTIHPRIRAWQKSIESGLSHYHYDETIPGSLPRDEMILRHRFPPQLFKLAFRSDFSFQSLWPKEAPIQHRHFDSLLYIDGTLYMLEATIDPDGVLYHFYARPIKSTQEFASRGITPPDEISHTEEAAPTEDLFIEVIAGSEVVYTPTNDAIITFEGHTYKLLKKLS
jgi:hypothetical protein